MAAPMNEQLKMFMSPREILDGWQPLDADREEPLDPRGGEMTMRPFTTMGVTNRGGSQGFRRHYELDPKGGTSETDDQLWSRKLVESQMSAADYAEVHGGRSGGDASFDYDGVAERTGYPQHRTGHTGTFEAREQSFLDRRLDSWADRQNDMFDEGSSLYNSVRSEGVRSPVHLGPQFGYGGKPQIVGGHHRLAAQNDINDETLMPVLHHEDLMSAVRSPVYKYS